MAMQGLAPGGQNPVERRGRADVVHPGEPAGDAVGGAARGGRRIDCRFTANDARRHARATAHRLRLVTGVSTGGVPNR